MSCDLNEFQNDRPVLLVRPSQIEESLKEDNFSCYTSCTFGFDGVIDGMDRYLKRCNDLTSTEIFEEQKKELFMITGDYARELFNNGDYELLLAYVENDKIFGYGEKELSRTIRHYLMRNNLDYKSNPFIQKIVETLVEHDNREKVQRHL